MKRKGTPSLPDGRAPVRRVFYVEKNFGKNFKIFLDKLVIRCYLTNDDISTRID